MMPIHHRARRLVHFSPLRYPGGKGRLAPFIKSLIQLNKLSDGVYIEPYAGGAGIAVELLLQEYVSAIYINDVSRPVWALWKSVLENTDLLVRLIRKTKVSVAEWDRQKKIFSNPLDVDDLQLGFAAFYLNRTNRSGIFNGGIIGGRDQSGAWKINARYNVEELIYRIESIASMRSRINLSMQDAKVFLSRGIRTWPTNALIYLDPPYYSKGKALYLDFYEHEDHQEISRLMMHRFKKQKWIVSYDNIEAVRKMYRGCRRIEYSLSYSAREARTGMEAMFFCEGLQIPDMVSPMKSATCGLMSQVRSGGFSCPRVR
jgi:DNA adenine methylase